MIKTGTLLWDRDANFARETIKQKIFRVADDGNNWAIFLTLAIPQ